MMEDFEVETSFIKCLLEGMNYILSDLGFTMVTFSTSLINELISC
jgi:hypothetical protein